MSSSAFPLSDENNPQPSASDDSQSIQSNPSTQSPTPNAATAPAQPTTAPSQPPQTQPAKPAQPNSNGTASGSVSNAPAVQHPAVARASLMRNVALALAGGPRYATTIDPQTGATTRTQVPLSTRDIGLAIAMEALSGAASGFGVTGPGAVGKAAAAGFNQVSAQQLAANAQQEQQAQTDADNASKALVRKASIFSQNQQSILAAQQAERLGIENMNSYVDSQSELLDGYKEQDAVGEQHVTYADIQAGLASGKYDPSKVTTVPDGINRLDGKPELTYSIITKPEANITLSQDQVDELAKGHVRGYPSGMKIPAGGFPVKGYMLSSAFTQLMANKMTMMEASDVANTLAKSSDPRNQELAKAVPDFNTLLDDKSQGPVLQSALAKLPKYMHHDGSGDNFYQALIAMSQPTRPSPSNPKQSVANTADASAAQVVAGAFGSGDPAKGWQVLKAYHEEITPDPVKSESEAESILSDSASTPREKAHAQAFLNLSSQQKANEAGADAKARSAAKPSAGAGTGPASGDVQQTADAIAQGRATFEQATSGMGKEASAFRRQVESDLLRRYPSVNIGALKAFSSAASNAGVQSQITNARSLFGANGQPGSFDNLEDTIRSVPKARFPVLSEIGQRTAYELGSPQMATLRAVKTDIASDLAKFNSGGGNHSSDHQIELYREQLNSAQTPEQVDAVLKDLRAISSKRLAGLVGTNPFLSNMTADINDPVTKQPRSNAGASTPQSAGASGQVIPAGAQIGRDAQGRAVGYKLPNGQYVSLGGQ